MKDSYFRRLDRHQLDYWRYKFEKKIAFNVSIVYAINMMFIIHAVLILSAYILMQEPTLNVLGALNILDLVLRFTIWFILLVILDLFLRLAYCFYWRHKERKWLDKVVSFNIGEGGVRK